MNNNSAEQYFPRSTRSSTRTGEFRRRSPRGRTPSNIGYLIVAIAAAVALFFGLWWVLVTGGDEAPWIPAGLVASVVLLVALSAREVVVRRAWTKHLLEQGIHEHPSRETGSKTRSGSRRTHSTSVLASALRAIQKQSFTADATGSSPEAHLDIFHLCRDYSATAEDALQSNNLPAEKRMALKSGQEKVKVLQRHHLLTWARESSRALTAEAQQKARVTDKIESANKAVQCLDSALKIYPDEPELKASKVALNEFIASVKVGHWVELAERSAFKGQYRRAISRYKDALFYLTRETVSDDVRVNGERKIKQQIEILEAQLRTRGDKQSGQGPTREGVDE